MIKENQLYLFGWNLAFFFFYFKLNVYSSHISSKYFQLLQKTSKSDVKEVICLTAVILPSATSKDETPSQDPGHFLELLASSQARRLDDQRASPSHFPGLRLSTCSPPPLPSTSNAEPAPPSGNEIRGPAIYLFFSFGSNPLIFQVTCWKTDLFIYYFFYSSQQ